MDPSGPASDSWPDRWARFDGKGKEKKSNLLNNLEKYPLSEAAVKMAEIRRQFLLPLKIAFDRCVCV